ncbi:MAG TPA: RDD family protein [Candidatus Diapherotrites archaeon]|uniref:RDD family protein n=1 Tax=Candidatus Iainarchaeum sp. TaxID=3101447 RepID=A0A7J4J443_9ARCH|nr:RDD family protein [Candidatus Diapherotrites archaeon]
MTAGNFAGFWERFAAHAIDNIFLMFSVVFFSVLAGFLLWVIRPLLSPLTGPYSALGMGLIVGILFYLLVPFLYYTYFIGKTGQTFGKSVMKIRVADKNGNSIGYLKAFFRILLIELFFLILIPLSLAFLLIVFDRAKQGLHDKILGTFVVKEGKSYFDVKSAIKIMALATGVIAIIIIILISLAHAFPASEDSGSRDVDLWFNGEPEYWKGAKITFENEYLGSISSWDCTNFFNECILSLPRNKIVKQPYHKIFSSNGAECREWVFDETMLNFDSNYVVLDIADSNQSSEQNCLSEWW